VGDEEANVEISSKACEHEVSGGEAEEISKLKKLVPNISGNGGESREEAGNSQRTISNVDESSGVYEKAKIE
jgi:hypothetical protein